MASADTGAADVRGVAGQQFVIDDSGVQDRAERRVGVRAGSRPSVEFFVPRPDRRAGDLVQGQIAEGWIDVHSQRGAVLVPGEGPERFPVAVAPVVDPPLRVIPKNR